MNNAHPPLKPGVEGSSPEDLFPEVHETFRNAERERASRLIEHSAGCVDLRDVVSVKMLKDEPNGVSSGNPPTKKERSFEVVLKDGSTIRFEVCPSCRSFTELEARTPEVAAEWVDNLKKLMRYWTRRQRVE